jgi:hypothetical protein
MNLVRIEPCWSNHLGLVVGVVFHKLQWLEALTKVARAFILIDDDGLQLVWPHAIDDEAQGDVFLVDIFSLNHFHWPGLVGLYVIEHACLIHVVDVIW